MGWVPIFTFGSGSGGSSSGSSAPGPRGQAGATWLTGPKPPTLSQGNAGDFYLQFPGGNVYQKLFTIPLAPAQWVLQGNLTVGKPGKDGVDGKPGAPGTPGLPGPAGVAGTAGTSGSAGAAGGQGVGIPGQKGVDGATWFLGQDPPPATTGNVGDFYFQAAPPATIQGGAGQLLLQGPAGQTGRPGVPGAPGLPGSSIGAFGALFTPTTLGVWTLTNSHDGSVLASTRNGVGLNIGASLSDSMAMALKPIPSAPYSCIFYIAATLIGINYGQCGVTWYDPGTSNAKMISLIYDTATNYKLEVGYCTDGLIHTQATILSARIDQPSRWYKLTDDGVNHIYYASADGETWVQLATEARNTHVTPTRVGWFVNPRNSAGVPMGVAATCLSYQETSP